MHVLLPKMLCQVPVCSSWLLWKQGCVPLLQQLEDQEWRPQMPLNSSFLINVLYSHQELVLVLYCWFYLYFIIRSLIYWPSYSPPCEIYFTAPRGFVICKPHVTMRAAWPSLVNVILSISFMNEMCINLSIIMKNYRWFILLNAYDVGEKRM